MVPLPMKVCKVRIGKGLGLDFGFGVWVGSSERLDLTAISSEFFSLELCGIGMVPPSPLKVCKVRIDKDLSPDFGFWLEQRKRLRRVSPRSLSLFIF